MDDTGVATFDSHGWPVVVRGRMTNGRARVLDIDCVLGYPDVGQEGLSRVGQRLGKHFGASGKLSGRVRGTNGGPGNIRRRGGHYQPLKISDFGRLREDAIDCKGPETVMLESESSQPAGGGAANWPR